MVAINVAPTVWPVGFTSAGAADNPINLETLLGAAPRPLAGIRVFNNTSGTIYVAMDTPATPAAIPVLPGNLFDDDTKCGIVHIFTPVSVPINGGPPAPGTGPLGPLGGSVTVWGVV